MSEETPAATVNAHPAGETPHEPVSQLSSQPADPAIRETEMHAPTGKSRLAARAAELAAGILTWKALDWAFHYVAYPFAIWKLGLLRGGLLMTGLSLLVCLLLLRFYDRMGRDWLGIEFVKDQRRYAGSSRWRRGLSRLIARGDWIAFVVLSLRYDPFITTAYLRRGAYNGMTRRDWSIIVTSCLVSNGFWIALCFGGVSILRCFA